MQVFFLGHAEDLLKNSLTGACAIRGITVTRLTTTRFTSAVVAARTPITTDS